MTKHTMVMNDKTHNGDETNWIVLEESNTKTHCYQNENLESNL